MRIGIKLAKRRRARRDERGYALLLVFLMASAIAIMLYRQLPREAFESERDKEQMLIDRGEQYKRAIYLYYVSNNRQWPAKIEDLESTNNKRYLRRRYINPYTGKDEWRLIHTNGSFLTDSLVTPPPAQATPGSPGSTNASASFGGTGALTSSITTSTADPNAPPEVNAQVQRRPSDRTLVQNSNFQGQPGGPVTPGNDPGYQPFNPSALPPISLYPNGYNAAPTNIPGANGLPGLNQPGLNQIGFNQPGVNPPGLNQGGVNQGGVNQGGAALPGVPGFTIPGTNSPVTTPGISPLGLNPTGFNQPGNQPINPATNQPFQVQPFPGQLPGQPNQPNAPGNVQGFGAPPLGVPGAPGGPGAAASNPALNLIQNLLTTPRQPPAGVGQPAPTGGGLAGVASMYKGPAIKSYGDRTKYQEWEFVFQLSQLSTQQAPKGAGPTGQTPGGPGGPGTPASTAPGSSAPGGGASTSPGMAGGFGTN